MVSFTFCVFVPTVASYMYKRSRVDNGGVHVKTHFRSDAIPMAVCHPFVTAVQVVASIFNAKHACIQGIANNSKYIEL